MTTQLKCTKCNFSLEPGAAANSKCPDCGENLHLFSEDKKCTIEDLGIMLSGPDAHLTIAEINDYLKIFAPPGNCPSCNSKLGGLMGSFSWGLCHGEGQCSCGWPCRGYHRPKNKDGEEIFTTALPVALPYHPSEFDLISETK